MCGRGQPLRAAHLLAEALLVLRQQVVEDLQRDVLAVARL
jgi:hypothetical protein